MCTNNHVNIRLFYDTIFIQSILSHRGEGSKGEEEGGRQAFWKGAGRQGGSKARREGGKEGGRQGGREAEREVRRQIGREWGGGCTSIICKIACVKFVNILF